MNLRQRFYVTGTVLNGEKMAYQVIRKGKTKYMDGRVYDVYRIYGTLPDVGKYWVMETTLYMRMDVDLGSEIVTYKELVARKLKGERYRLITADMEGKEIVI